MLRPILNRISPRRSWHRDVTPATLRADAIAGLTGAAIVLPQGVAFALIAGLPPEFGLFTAIVVTLVAALWGSSRVMVSGPTTAISALVFVTLSGMAEPGSAAYIGFALTLTLMVGLLQFSAGLAGLGALIAFVSHSVIVGFTAAAALLIAVSQVPGILGVSAEPGGGVLERTLNLLPTLAHVNGTALLIAATTLATLVLVIRVDRRIPAYIIALIVGSGVAWLVEAPGQGIAMFQPLGSLLPSVSVPQVSADLLGTLLPGAAAVAFVGLLEAISIGKAFAVRRNESYDSNQEIAGQGLSNIAGSFLQCYAGSGSFTRSGVNAESGACTPLAAVFAALFLFAGLFVVGPLVRFVPVPAMAAIILYVAWRLVNVAEIRHILRAERNETLILLATFLTGVLSDLDFAVFVGVIISLSMFLKNSAQPIVAVGAPTEKDGRRVFRNAEALELPECPQIRAMRIEGPLYFASTEHVEQEFDRIERRAGSRQARMLSLKGVSNIDLAGADFLVEQTRKARAMGRDLHLIAVSRPTLAALDRLGVSAIVGAANIHSHKAVAIAEMVSRADDAICRECSLRVFRECRAKPGAAAAVAE